MISETSEARELKSVVDFEDYSVNRRFVLWEDAFRECFSKDFLLEKAPTITNCFTIKVPNFLTRTGERPWFGMFITISSRPFTRMESWELLDGWEFGDLFFGLD